MKLKSFNGIILLIISCVLVLNCVKAHREFEIDGVKNILALEGEKVDIRCNSNTPMSYCVFVHPSGKRSSFTGTQLLNGHCEVNFYAEKTDSGTWYCYMGHKSAGVETTKQINVRIATELAAVKQNISVPYGKPVTLRCVTTKTYTSLSYCRFETPSSDTFSVDSDLNETRALLGRYYYPSNYSLDRGDCAVTINKVKHGDQGVWTCGAGIDGKEEIDFINLQVTGLKITTASASGVIFGIIGSILLLSLLAYVGWKERRILGTRASPSHSVGEEDQEMGPIRSQRSSPGPSSPRSRPMSRRGSPLPSTPLSSRGRPIPTVVIDSPGVASS